MNPSDLLGGQPIQEMAPSIRGIREAPGAHSVVAARHARVECIFGNIDTQYPVNHCPILPPSTFSKSSASNNLVRRIYAHARPKIPSNLNSGAWKTKVLPHARTGTLTNFPMQANGAEMLRWAALRRRPNSRIRTEASQTAQRVAATNTYAYHGSGSSGCDQPSGSALGAWQCCCFTSTGASTNCAPTDGALTDVTSSYQTSWRRTSGCHADRRAG